MNDRDAKRRFARAPVARLATVDRNHSPHLVPICFALAEGDGDLEDGDTLYSAVDAKPKTTPDLKRLRNIAGVPHVSILVDHYEDDWGRLWWVRADGAAHIVTDHDAAQRAVDLLVDRYPQYRRARPQGPVVAVVIDRISGWDPA